MPGKASPTVISVTVVILAFIGLYYPLFLAIIFGLFLFVSLWSYFEGPVVDKYFDNLRLEREGLSICDFAKEFDCKVVDTWIIRAVYEQIQENIMLDKEVPIKGSDRLYEDLGFESDDVDLDLAVQISQRTGRTMKGCRDNPYFEKVHTVADLVMFFNRQPRDKAT